ncbi:uncharacterized protein LOC120331551 [Styela clava]
MTKELLALLLISLLWLPFSSATCSIFGGNSTTKLSKISGKFIGEVNKKGIFKINDTCSWEFPDPGYEDGVFLLNITYLHVKHSFSICDDGFLTLPNGQEFCESLTQSDQHKCFMYTTTCGTEINSKCKTLNGSIWPPSITFHRGNVPGHWYWLDFTYKFINCSAITTEATDVTSSGITLSTTLDGDQQLSNLVVPIAAASGGILLLAIIVVIVIFWRQRKSNSSKPKPEKSDQPSSGNATTELSHENDVGYDTLHAVMPSGGASYATVDTNDEVPEAMYATTNEVKPEPKTEASGSNDTYTVVVKTKKSKKSEFQASDEGLNATYSVVKKKPKADKTQKSSVQMQNELYNIISEEKPTEPATYDTLSNGNHKKPETDSVEGNMYDSLNHKNAKKAPNPTQGDTYDSLDHGKAPEPAASYGTLDHSAAAQPQSEYVALDENAAEPQEDQESQLYSVVNKQSKKRRA